MSYISSKAKIGKDVEIGNFVTIGPDVEIGDGCRIESYSYIGYDNGRGNGKLILGPNAHIRSHSILYTGSIIGANLLTGHQAIIRENCNVGDSFQAGTKTVLMGNLTVGDHVRTGSNVEIGETSNVGDFVWIYLNTSLITDRYPPSNDISGPSIGNFSVIGAHSLIYPRVCLGHDVLVGAGCIVTKDLDSERVAVGSPMRVLGSVKDLTYKKDGQEHKLYPWRNRFSRGYPDDIVEGWLKESQD